MSSSESLPGGAIPAAHETAAVRRRPESAEHIFEGIHFTARPLKHGGFEYVNSAPGRKMIVLRGESGPPPEMGVGYRVQVVEDTKPGEPASGRYMVELLDVVGLSIGEWQDVDLNLNDLEDIASKKVDASHVLFQETGVTKADRDTMKPDQILDKARRKLVAGVAMEDEGTYTLLEEGKMTPAMEALIALRRKNLRTAIEKATAIDAEGEKLREQEKEIILGIEGQPSSAEITALRRVRGYIEGNRERREELYDSSPEAFYGLHLQELRAYKKKAETRRIIETPYVRRQAEDIATHLQADRPVLIYGHLGTGKSELALHVASEYILKDREPAQGALVISGSKNMALAELYGHQMLSVDSVAGDDLDMFTKEVEEKFEEWKAGHGSASEGEKDRAHDRILQAYLTKYKGGTISKFFLGPIYRAMREGRPIIIDEVNAIPHEILISLNHILTRRVGDVMEVQQDSGEMVEIKPGFGVIMTANLNQGQARYVDRQELDPAFLSRLYKIEHDYLPQVAEGSLIDEAGPENELFQVLLARVMDDRGGVELPAGELDKLWKLAQVARVFQDNFAGRTTGNTHFFKQGVAPAVPYTLQESVLSMRALDNIVTQWQAEGYQYELDYYVWKEFGSQSTNPTDRAFIYQQCKDGPGFFSTTGWEPAPNYGTGGKVTSFDVPLPKNRSAEAIYTGQRQVVQCAFGDKEPLRTVWPSVSKKA